MSEVKRYDPSDDAYGNSKGMKWSPYGDYVLAEDYDALRAENAELVAALIEAQKIINHQGWSASEQPAYDFIDAALAKPVVPPVYVMAKALSDRHAKELNIDKDDNWKLYGQAYIEEVEAMLTAAPNVDTKWNDY